MVGSPNFSNEQECREAYARAGWTYYWPYDRMPAWLRPAWHHEAGATEVR